MKTIRTIIAAAVLAALAGSASAEVYLWPLHGQRRLSSSFGEYREGHYHAGIDLRSFGSVGLPCLAVSDGWVSRARVSPQGYGKALYLKLSDGRTAVYAHIDCFDAALDSLIWAHRVRKGSAWCDLSFEEGRLPVSVGDTICFSGSTGTTAPHLHFELRDEGERPFNPLEDTYSLPDRTAPLMSGIVAVPVRSPSGPVESLVDGLPVSGEKLFRAAGSEHYALYDTIHVQGAVYFGVSVWDEQGFGRYPMAPMMIELVVDGQTVYTLRNSIFSFTQSSQIELEYEMRGKGPAGRYTLLYRKEGNTRSDRSGAGIVHSMEGYTEGLYLEKGLHRAQITATDASGNISRADFVFSTGEQPVISEARRLDAVSEMVVEASDPDGGEVEGRVMKSLDGGSTWLSEPLEPFAGYSTASMEDSVPGLYVYRATDDEGAWSEAWLSGSDPRYEEDMAFFELKAAGAEDGLRVEASSDRAIAGEPVLTLSAGARRDTLDLYRRDARSFVALVPPERIRPGTNVLRVSGRDYRGYSASAALAVTVLPMSSGAEASVVLGDSVSAIVESPSVRGTAVIVVADRRWPAGVPEGLRPMSSPFEVSVAAGRLRRGLRIRAAADRRTGLFEWDDEKGWKCVGIPAMEEGTAPIGRSGTYCFFSDGIPPMIAHAALDPWHGGGGFFRRSICVLPVTEEGSGIDPYSAVARLNGDPVVVEWDAPRDRLVIPLPRSIPAGAVRLEVEVSDMSGNRTVSEFGFVLQ